MRQKSGLLNVLATIALLAPAAMPQISPVTVSPSILAFGNVALGSSLQKKVTVKNNQAVTLALSRPSIAGSLDFAVISGGNCGAQLGPGASCTYQLAFTPTALASESATLAVNDNASNSPQTVSLSGTGSAPATVSPTSVSFPSQLITTTSAPKTVTLSNNQSVALSITAPTITTPFALAGGTCGTSLAPFSKCTYLMTFTAPGLGTFKGSLTINPVLSSGPLVVNLSGTGGTNGIQSLSINPTSASIPSGTTQQFTATANLTAGGTMAVTGSAHWSSDNAVVAKVNASGLASALSAGTAHIKAGLGGTLAAVATLTSLPVMVSIAVTPQNLSLPLGARQQFAATGLYSDGSTQDLTSAAAWRSSTNTVANITTGGLATATAKGTTTISCKFGSMVGSTKLQVVAPEPVSIAITPGNISMAAGDSQQLAAFAAFTDGSTHQLTSSLTWQSSDTNIATISSAGIVQGVSVGSTTLSVTSGSITGSAMVTVSAPALRTIVVMPANTSVAAGSTQQLTASGVFSDSSTIDLTTAATWTSSDSAAAAMTPDGVATALTAGWATITAAAQGVSGSTVLSVTQTGTTLQSITVSSASPSVDVGATQQFTATGNFSDGSTRDLTGAAQWYLNQVNARYPSDPNFAQYGVPSGLLTGVLTELDWNAVDMGPDAADGQYQWGAFDQSIASSIAAGKKIDIAIWIQNYPGKPTTIPPYVQAYSTNVVPGCTNYPRWIAPPYSPDFLAAYKNFLAEVVRHFANNPAIGYVRVGMSSGGEVHRYCGPTLDSYPAPSPYSDAPFNCSSAANVGRCVWLAYDQDVLNFVQSQNPTFPVLGPTTSENQSKGDPGNVYPSTEAEQAVEDGFGFGNQGLQKSDLTSYAAGRQCNANWCGEFDLHNGQVPLELQTGEPTDPVCTGMESNCDSIMGSLVDLLPFADTRHATILEIYEDDVYIALNPFNPNYANYGAQYATAMENALQTNPIAAVNASGIVTGVAPGSTTIFVQYGGITGSAAVNVTTPVLAAFPLKESRR